MTAAEQQPIFVVDDASDLPIWAQLRNRFAYLIKTGFFGQGEQLPSVRSVAASAHINYNTVTKAYRELELTGLIVNVRGRGMYVRANAAEDTEAASIDAVVEDCIYRYRGHGMTYDDVRDHLADIVERLQAKADAEASGKVGYRDAE